MSRSPESVIEELEEALLERARKLAKEYLARAQRARQHILEDAQERLRLREQQAVVRAQTEAERFYRRQIQASELGLQKRMDQLRWDLIQSVLKDASRRLEELAADADRYETILGMLTREAAISIEKESLVAEMNARDLQRLQPRWDVFVDQLQLNKTIELHPRPLNCSGGVLVRCKDNRIRVDNTFEGRMERLETQVLQVATERLFAAEISQRGLLNE